MSLPRLDIIRSELNTKTQLAVETVPACRMSLSGWAELLVNHFINCQLIVFTIFICSADIGQWCRNLVQMDLFGKLDAPEFSKTDSVYNTFTKLTFLIQVFTVYLFSRVYLRL